MSVFYNRLFNHRFAVPLLALERLGALRSELPPVEACLDVLQTCCGIATPTEADVEYLLTRVEEGARTPAAETSTGPAKKTLGTSYNEFIGSLDTSDVLLWMCDYDYARAAHLFTSVDYLDVRRMVDLFVRRQAEQNLYTFECVMYGFGGGYKDDGGSGEVKEFDLSQGITPDMLAKINAGMMQ